MSTLRVTLQFTVNKHTPTVFDFGGGNSRASAIPVTPTSTRRRPKSAHQAQSPAQQAGTDKYHKRKAKARARHGPPVMHQLLDHFDQDDKSTHDGLL